jgi:GDPmannose 4,6-dehydratase
VVGWDFRDTSALAAILSEHRPALAFNFAAYSSGEGMFEDPVGIAKSTGWPWRASSRRSATTDPAIRFCQGLEQRDVRLAQTTPQNESTPFRPRSPYGAAKLYAHSMVDIYRRSHGLFACSAILFNHESPRRGLRFVTRKVVRAAAMIRLGWPRNCAWATSMRAATGASPATTCAACARCWRHGRGGFVFATGVVHSVRELCELAFQQVGLDWREHVRSEALDYPRDRRRTVARGCRQGSFATRVASPRRVRRTRADDGGCGNGRACARRAGNR